VRPGCGLLSALLICAGVRAESTRQVPGPLYTPSSIVNGAHPGAAPLASNTIATIYGSDLAYASKGLTAEEIRGGMLPSVLIGTGVRVLVNNIQAAIYYVSPGQINFLVPELRPGETEIRVGREALYGPAARVRIGSASPALFQMDPEFAIVTRADGSLVTSEAPAQPGQVVILYATGLGSTKPRFLNGEVPTRAAVLERMTEFRVEISGQKVGAADILYAGVAPGFPGLYQINLRLPAGFRPDPEVRIGFEEAMSPAGVRMHAVTGNP
jgi:uncharacterized protein (TIGR03437 family)